MPLLVPKWRNGRRGGLKNRWGQPRAGSSPAFGTILRPRPVSHDRIGHYTTRRRTASTKRKATLCAAVHLPNVTDEAQRKAILSAARHCPVHESITSAEAIEIPLDG